MSKNWKQTGLDIIDPGNIYHDPEAQYGPMHEYWQAIAPYASMLGMQQLANPNEWINQGWNLGAESALDPNNMALLTGSRDYANRILSGEMLDPETNKALAMELQRGLESAGAFDSQAESAGRYGSGAWGQMKGRSLADLQGNLYGKGLDLMTTMSGLAPSLYSAQMAPAEYISNLGRQKEARPWETINRMTNVYAQQGAYDAPYYEQNPVMGGIGTVISAIGAIKGMGGGQQQSQPQGPQQVQYNPQSWSTQNTGYSGGNNWWSGAGQYGW